MCREHQQSSAVARRLGQFNFIIDRFHATGLVGEFCGQHFLPDLPENQSILFSCPADIVEGDFVEGDSRITTKLVNPCNL